MRAFPERTCIQEVHRIAREIHEFIIRNAPGIAKSFAECAHESAHEVHDRREGLSVEPVGIEAEGGVRLHPRKEHHERHHGDDKDLCIRQEVGCREGLVGDGAEWQEAVKQIRIYAVEEAEAGAKAHRDVHILRELVLHDNVFFLFPKENEVAHLQCDG